jgi:glycerol-3-phosphate dehydrogenase
MEAEFRVANTLPLPLAMAKRKSNGFRVCVIGGGGTGAALAYDLALRGFSVIVLEKGELTSGTTGRHHGQLHCGARYAYGDRAIARECYEESLILSRIAPECIEYNGGFFVAFGDEEAAFAGTFSSRCAEAGIPTRMITREELLRREPALSPSARLAVEVPDGSFDAFRLPMMFFAAAKALGAVILPWHEVVEIIVSGGKVTGVSAVDRSREGSGLSTFKSDFVINAAGAWAGKVGKLAGLDIPLVPAPGAMLAVRERLTNHVISRLRPPSDGDILVPQRGLSIIGSTQRITENPDGILPAEDEIALLRHAGEEISPLFHDLPTYAVWAAARPLVKPRSTGFVTPSLSNKEGRNLSRDFAVVDHEMEDKIKGIATILGGKATVLRAMAEKTVDFVCAKTAVSATCSTASYALPSWRSFYKEAR